MEQNLAMTAAATGTSPAALEPQVRAGTRNADKAAAGTAEAQQTSGMNSNQAQSLADKAQAALKARGVDLKFTVCTDTEQIEVEVRDASSDKLICKLPPENLVQVEQSASGLLSRPA